MPIRRTLILASLAALLAGSMAFASDQAPSTQPARTILFTHATIHTVSGKTIEDGSLLLRDGKIAAIGKVDVPADATVIDCTEKEIYPGLIDSSDQLGLTEIDSVRGTLDMSETGAINPNARAQIAVNPDSELIPTTRSNGILIAHVMPTGGLFSGTSAVMMLDGWTYEQMTLQASAGVVMNWPSMQTTRDADNPEAARQQVEGRARVLKQIDQVFDDARAYERAASVSTATTRATNFDARWEAMRPVLNRTIPLFIRSEEMGQINAAVAFAKRQNVRCVIVGGRDADRCIDLLKAEDVPVIFTGTHRVPGSADDGYDAIYSLPAKLKAGGIRFAITTGGWTMLARNLPYQAASAIAFDLPRDDALKSITLWPAQILGIDARVGSIEVGKDATIFIADGDILEIPTHVERAYVQGREVDLNDRHKMLRDKYQKRIDAATQPSTPNHE